MSLLKWVLPAAVASLAACDPGYSIRGHVREPASCAEAPERAKPLAGATIEVICPGDYGSTSTFMRLPTSSDGSFSKSGIGAMSLDCTVTVNKPGYVARKFLVSDLCASDWGGICGGLTVEALLSPEQPATGSTATPAAPP